MPLSITAVIPRARGLGGRSGSCNLVGTIDTSSVLSNTSLSLRAVNGPVDFRIRPAGPLFPSATSRPPDDPGPPGQRQAERRVPQPPNDHATYKIETGHHHGQVHRHRDPAGDQVM